LPGNMTDIESEILEPVPGRPMVAFEENNKRNNTPIEKVKSIKSVDQNHHVSSPKPSTDKKETEVKIVMSAELAPAHLELEVTRHAIRTIVGTMVAFFGLPIVHCVMYFGMPRGFLGEDRDGFRDYALQNTLGLLTSVVLVGIAYIGAVLWVGSS